MASNVGIMINSFLVNSWIIIHFGINPESGGRPPRDIINIRMSEVIRGVLFHVCDRDAVVVVELCINSMKVVSVIMM